MKKSIFMKCECGGEAVHGHFYYKNGKYSQSILSIKQANEILEIEGVKYFV
jgi:hypothetical protein